MRLLPHTVTLYNVEKSTDPETMEDTLTNHITVLNGGFLSPVRAAAGNDGQDAVSLHIPFSVAAEYVVDDEGEVRVPCQYVDSATYHAAADKTGLWTLEPSPACFFVNGVVVEPSLSYQQINAAYPDVYAITDVETCDYGAEAMRHWEVTGV